MRKRSGALIVSSYEELLDEVSPTQMKHRDQMSSPVLPTTSNEDSLSTQADEEENDSIPVVPTVKLLVFGSKSVGKSALVTRFVTGRFEGKYEPTNGCEIRRMELKIARVEEMKVEIWEVAVSLDQACLSAYYKSAKSALVVFDPLCSDSCGYIHTVRSLFPAEKPLIAVANRAQIAIPSDISTFAVSRSVRLFTADAKSGENVEEVFQELTKAGVS